MKTIRFRQLTAGLLAALMLLTLLPGPVWADTVASGSCGAQLSWTLDSAGSLTISGSGAMEDYRLENGAPWHTYAASIRSVTVRQGVTGLGCYALADCEGLQSAELPESLTAIGDYAFLRCGSLTELRLPEGLTRLGVGVFYGCGRLDSIRVPAGITRLENGLFFQCSSLSRVELPEGLTHIGGSAFACCEGLRDISLPQSLTVIDTHAFAGCTGLQSIALPGGVSSIGTYAFSGCTALSSVTLPEGLQSLGASAFCDCGSLTDIALPSGVTLIDEYTFSGCGSLGSVHIPDSVTRIAAYAFADCEGLTDVFYGGTQAQWEALALSRTGNGALLIATVHYALPEAPVIRSANVASSGAIQLSWDAMDGAVRYEIYRAIGKNGSYSKYTTVTATSWTNKSVTPGRTYYYQVRAVYADGTTSPFSSIVSRTADCARPVVSTSIVAGSGAIRLSWDAVDGASGYEIYRATGKSGSYSKYTTVTSTSWTNKSVTPGRTYYYKVKALCGRSSYGNSALSSAVSRTADCARPVVKTANVASSGAIRLSWDAVDGADSYEIYRATGKNGSYSKYTTVTSTSWTNSSVTPGRTYYYKVKALCGRSSYGDSALSSAVSRTADCARPVVNITNVASSGAIRLSWGAVDGADSYEIYRATGKNDSYSKYTTVTSTSWTNSSVTPGRTYYYKVKALCGRSSYGDSALSSAVSRTADCARPQVSISSSSGRIRLSWGAVAGAYKYVVYRSEDGGQNYRAVRYTANTTYTNQAVTPGVTYYYRVKAKCSRTEYGDSALSSVVSIRCK